MREALSWSQMELAYRSGITQAKLSNIENNAARAGIRADTLKAICAALGVSADYLLGLTDNPTPR
ncbi:MAG: helix-turn-helix transcriptional regulator [Planctomycetes bacterium]|nr:helix-turn-helix transcriptional regulator [Planctomycetota bacterium]